jgi:hypothetical protein
MDVEREPALEVNEEILAPGLHALDPLAHDAVRALGPPLQQDGRHGPAYERRPEPVRRKM